VEVEAIGHVRHKNLVRLLGYCVEGVNRYVRCLFQQPTRFSTTDRNMFFRKQTHVLIDI
jgi:hypothetical protein